ncbi:MAG: hypothetical protein LBF97_02250 [Elusimicrobiota bacterium]|jgi:hypothetical protein|nr:hypothetical protein [Elusimicrobiota bacterium]
MNNLKQEILEDAGIIEEGWVKRATMAALLGGSLATGAVIGIKSDANKFEQTAVEANYEAERYDKTKALTIITTVALLAGIGSAAAGIGSEFGYKQGQKDGYESGQREGYKNGQKEGFENGHKVGYKSGKKDGFEAAKEEKNKREWDIKRQNIFASACEMALKAVNWGISMKILSDIYDGFDGGKKDSLLNRSSATAARITGNMKARFKRIYLGLKAKIPKDYMLKKNTGVNKKGDKMNNIREEIMEAAGIKEFADFKEEKTKGKEKVIIGSEKQPGEDVKSKTVTVQGEKIASDNPEKKPKSIAKKENTKKKKVDKKKKKTIKENYFKY